MVPPRQTSLDKREAELFQGREDLLELVRHRMADPLAPGDREVLLFTGVGGIGKSALARRMVRELRGAYEQADGYLATAKPAWAAIDVGEAWSSDSVTALLQIRLQLGMTWRDARFPVFDFAFARIHAERAPSSNALTHYGLLSKDGAIVQRLARSLPSGLKDSDVLQDAASGINELLEDTPLLGLGYKYLNRIFQGATVRLDKRTIPLLDEVSKLGADGLEQRLPECLGTDIKNAIRTADKRRPVFLVVDTIEGFHRDRPHTSGVGAFYNDLSLRNLIWHAPGITFLLLGRDKVEWPEHEDSPVRDWQGLVQHHPLSHLTNEEVGSILERFPVTQPELRGVMREGAAGLPFYLGLQLDIYGDLLEEGIEPEASHFAAAPHGVLTRFISHIGERRAGTLTTLAHARRFDSQLFVHLRDQPELHMGDSSLAEIARFSFVEGNSEDGYRLHQHYRDIERERLAASDPDRQAQIDRALFAYWDERCQPAGVRSLAPSHEVALQEAFYHNKFLSPAGSVGWLNERSKLFYTATRLLLLKRLLEDAVQVIEGAAGDNATVAARTMGNLAIVLADLDDLLGAKVAQERALAIIENVYGPEHAEVARNLGNLGVVLLRLDDLSGARAAHERALAINEAVYGPKHAMVAVTVTNLGNVLNRLNDLSGAKSAHERALAIMEKAYGPEHAMVAQTLGNLGLVLDRLDDLSGARAAHERTLAILEKVYGPEHAHVALALENLGLVLYRLIDLSGARSAHERALAIKEKVYGLEHAQVAQTLGNLANVLYLLDDLSGAKSAQERALAVKEKVYGPDHSDVAKARKILARTLERLGETEEAVALRERATSGQVGRTQ